MSEPGQHRRLKDQLETESYPKNLAGDILCVFVSTTLIKRPNPKMNLILLTSISLC